MTESFTESQLFRLWPVYITSSSLFLLLQPILFYADYEGWMGYILSYPLTLFLVYFAVRIAQVDSTGNWIKSGGRIVGRWLHSFSLILILYYCLFTAIHNMLEFTSWLHTSHLYETPSLLITLVFIICPTFLASLGLRSIIYFIDGAFLIIIPIFFANIPLIGTELDYSMFPALFTHFEIQKIAYSAYYVNHWFGDLVILLLILMPRFHSVKKPVRTLAKSHAVVIILHLFYWLGALFLFGPYLGGHLQVPMVELINHVSLRIFLENFEPFILILGLTSFVSKIALFLYIISAIFQFVFHLKDRAARFLPILTSILITWGTEFLANYPAQMQQYTKPFYASLFVIQFIPLVYFLIYQLRFRRKEQPLSN